jgi:hypothetical protein
MTDLVIFKTKGRMELAKIKQGDLEKKLSVLLSACSQLMGQELKGKPLIFATEQLSEILKNTYKRYDFSEIEQIFKNGFANYGTEYRNVSVTACISILKRFEEDTQNRDKLQKAIDNFSNIERGVLTEEERHFQEKKSQYLAFSRAKEKYEKGKITNSDIYFCFSLCYNHIKENLRDNSIDISIEKRREIWEKIKEMYENYNTVNLSVLTATLLQTVPPKIMQKTMFKSVLFHLWAVKNFEVTNIDDLPL